MHGRLMEGVQCCLKGCENEAGSRKFDSMVGQYELKCAPDDVIPENLKDLSVCDKHYSSLSARGHKPPKGKSSTRSRSDAQLGNPESYTMHSDLFTMWQQGFSE